MFAELSYSNLGQTQLSYPTATGLTTWTVSRPTALLVQAPPTRPLHLDEPYPLLTPAQALEALFTDIPLNPELNWQAPETSRDDFKAAFALALQMLRLPCDKRWAVRGEPDHFLMGGFQPDPTHWTLFALVLKTGKPATLTFRCEDIICALPPPAPFATMNIAIEPSHPDFPPIEYDKPWDTRVKLDLPHDGGAIITLAISAK